MIRPAIPGPLRAWAWRRGRGTAAAEFAIVTPVAMLLCAGIIEAGGLLEVTNATNQLATQYALAWADCSDSPAGTCSTELSAYTAASTIANLAPQLVASRLTLQMFQVTNSGGSLGITYAYPTGATLSSAQTAAGLATFASGQAGVIVSATYAHTLNFFPTLMTPFFGNDLTVSFTVAQIKD
jgi:Flp pilus assembly protein TadG